MHPTAPTTFRRVDAVKPKFEVGQIVLHVKFGYRGVVFGVDETFSLTDEWYETVARSRPPKNAPWYHVLVDGASHTTYVAERHLAASADRSQVAHPRARGVVRKLRRHPLPAPYRALTMTRQDHHWDWRTRGFSGEDSADGGSDRAGRTVPA